MTVKVPANRLDYVGNGVATEFAYSWRIMKAEQLAVWFWRPAIGERKLELGVDYNVTDVGRKAGGKVVMTFTPSSDAKIVIVPNFAYEQETDFRNQGAFLPETHEDEFDRQTMMAKQNRELAGRAVRTPITIKPSEFNPELPRSIVGSPRRTIITNESGDGFSEGPTADQIFDAESHAAAANQSAIDAAGSAESALNFAEIALTAAAEDTLLFFAGETSSTATFVTSSRVVSVTDGEYLGYPTWNIEVKND